MDQIAKQTQLNNYKGLIYINSCLLHIKVSMEKDVLVEYPIPPDKIGKIISQLSSNQHYVLIYPRQDLLKGKHANLFKPEQMNPYLLVFEDEENSTGLDLISQYLKENNLAINQKHVYLQEYQTGFFLANQMNLSQLKWQMEDDTIDGYCFQVSVTVMNYDPEASMQQMIDFDNKLKKNKKIAFYIPQNNSYFYVKQDPNDTLKTFSNKIVNEIKKSFKVTVKPDKIKLTFMHNKKQLEVDEHNFRKLSNKDYVYVAFVDKVNLPKQNFLNQTQFIIFKDIDKEEQTKIPYNQLRMQRVDTILDKLLNFKERGLNSSEHGLRIHDIILKPCDILSDHPQLQQHFLSQSKYVKVVLAYVIKQSFIFYAHLEGMDELNCPRNKNRFNDLLEKSTNNESLRRKCEETIRDRAKTAPNIAFKKQQNIEPILYYTSELRVKEGRNSQKLYDAYNTYLRKIQFGNVDVQQYGKWQFLFTKSLVKALKLIEEYKGDLYRGVSHPETYKIGKILKFKQFNSCTPNINVALSFAGRAIYIFKNCRMGRNILHYSYFQEEEEVLNLPYLQYRIVNIKKIKHDFKDLQEVTLQEVYRPELKFDLNDQPLLFVLWVDGEEGEGSQFSKNISQVRQSTSFIHLTSTKELETWLKTNKDKLADKTISTVLITNMTRTENGVKNELAGVHAIKAYRLQQPQGKVMLYIGNIDSAKDKLNNNQIPLNTLTIGNTDYSLLQFFFNTCGIS